MNKIQFKQHFATTFRPLTKTNMVLIYQSIIVVHFTMLVRNACIYHLNKKNLI